MATRIQVVLDCSDAVASGLWWAETLGWQYEWLDRELFAQIKAGGMCSDDDVIEVDGKLTWKDGAAINSGEQPLEVAQRIYFQTVPEPKVVKNRMHIDVRVGEDARDAKIVSLIARGATRIGEGRQGPHSWVVMADPDGNEFCLT